MWTSRTFWFPIQENYDKCKILETHTRYQDREIEQGQGNKQNKQIDKKQETFEIWNRGRKGLIPLLPSKHSTFEPLKLTPIKTRISTFLNETRYSRFWKLETIRWLKIKQVLLIFIIYSSRDIKVNAAVSISPALASVLTSLTSDLSCSVNVYCNIVEEVLTSIAWTAYYDGNEWNKDGSR